MSVSRTLSVSIIAVIVATFVAPPVGADEGPVSDLSAATHPAGADDELAPLVADILLALGVDSGIVDDAAVRGASLRLGMMLDDGAVTVDQLDALVAQAGDGSLPGVIAEFIEDVRSRRDAYRAAAEALLEELGVELGDGESVRDAFAANGIDVAEFAERLREELPPPQTPAGDEPAPVPTTVPSPTTTAPPRTTTTPPPTTTVPAPEYPTPAPAPAPEYPTPATAPAPKYPTAGDSGESGSDSV